MRFSSRSGMMALLLAAASLGGGVGAAPTPAQTQSVNEKSSMPEPSRRGRRYAHEILQLSGLGGGGVVPGGVTGSGWIRRRTNNFRRKGVGSKWQTTMFKGRV